MSTRQRLREEPPDRGHQLRVLLEALAMPAALDRVKAHRHAGFFQRIPKQLALVVGD